MWAALTSHYPVVGAITILYTPNGRPAAYAAGVDDARLAQLVARLNRCACGHREMVAGYGMCAACRDAQLRSGGSDGRL